jgi:hypothetical protein
VAREIIEVNASLPLGERKPGIECSLEERTKRKATGREWRLKEKSCGGFLWVVWMMMVMGCGFGEERKKGGNGQGKIIFWGESQPNCYSPNTTA